MSAYNECICSVLKLNKSEKRMKGEAEGMAFASRLVAISPLDSGFVFIFIALFCEQMVWDRIFISKVHFARVACSQSFQEERWKIMAQAALLSIEGPRRILDLIHSTAYTTIYEPQMAVLGSQQYYFGLSLWPERFVSQLSNFTFPSLSHMDDSDYTI